MSDKKPPSGAFNDCEGEAARLIRSTDWSKTSLGPIEKWPRTLVSAVEIMLRSPAPLNILWGREGLMIYNDAYSKFAGARHPECYGKSCIEVWSEGSDLLVNVIDKVLQGESVVYREFPYTVYRNNFAEDVWLDLYFSPVPDDDGAPGGVQLINIETTAYMKTQLALKESEGRYRLVIEGSNDGIWDLNVDSGEAFWNDRLYEIFGYTREEVKNPGLAFMNEILHPDDKERVNAALQRSIREGVPYDSEYRVKHRDGYYKYIHGKGKPVYDENGRLTRLVGIGIDIDERKKAEESSRQSEERFSGIFNQTSVGIAQTDLTGKFVLVNERFCEMVGRIKNELYAMRMQELTHGVELPENVQLFKRAVTEGIPFRIEKRYVRPDGSHIWVHNNVSLIKDPAGKPMYIVAISQDITDRKKAEEALKESEQRFRTMAEASGILIAYTDEAGKAIYFNKQWLDATGRSMEDLIDFGWADLLHPDDKDGFINAYMDAFAKKVEMKREFRLMNKNGEYRWQLAIVSPRFGPDKSFAGFISSCIDITERKHAEEAQKASEGRFRIMAEAAPNLVWTLTKDGSLTYMNQYGLDLLNTTLADMVRDNWPPYVHPDDLGPVSAAVREAFAARANFRFEYRIRSHNNEYRWVLSSANPVFWADGTFDGYVGTSVDITERKHAEEALQAAEEHWRTLANKMQNLVWMAEPNGDIFWYNKRWYEYTGTTPEEMVGWGWQKVHDAEELPKVMERWQRSINTGGPFEMVFPLKGTDGVFRPFLTRVVPITDNTGSIIRWFGTNTDITEQIKVEEELKQAQQTLKLLMQKKDEFMAVASHELKTPLTTVKASLQLLERLTESSEDPAVRSFLNKATNQVDKLTRLVSDLLDVSKIQAGKMPFDLRKFKMGELLEDCLVFARAEGSHRIVLKGDLGISVRADKNRLEQAVCNLLSNAVKYSPGADEVIVEVKKDASNVTISVQDFGIGIEEEKLPYVFDRFFRVDESSMKFSGLGLGLYITSEIIKRHGGQMHVKSELGKGSVFYFTLPLA